MIPHALLAAALLSADARFDAAFPGATTVEAPAGGRLTSASGFAARGLGDGAEAPARTFLRRYGAAFGVSRRQQLVAVSAPAAGRPGAVRFTRLIDGSPIFDGDVVVGIDAAGAVVLVNAADVPPRVAGRVRLSRREAIRAAAKAMPDVEFADGARAKRGWLAAGEVARPVWRVDAVGLRPPGEWRTYVDAESGRILLRQDLRVDGGRGGGH